MSVHAKIARAYLTSLLGVASGLLTTLWLLRRVALAVSPHDLGVHTSVLQAVGYLAVLQLGLDFAASRQIAEELGRNDITAANRNFWELVRTNRRLLSVGALGVVVVAAAVALRTGNGFASLGLRIAVFAGVAQLVAFAARPSAAALIASQRQDVVNVIQVARTLFVSVVAVGLVARDVGVTSIAIAELTTQIPATAVLWALSRRYCEWIGEPSAPSAATRRTLLRFGGLSVLGGFAWTIESTCDVLILGALQGAAAVGIYGLWWRFPQMLFDVCLRLSNSAFPGLAHRYGGERSLLRRLVAQLSYVSVGLGGLALIGVSLWLPSLMMLWVGPTYSLPAASRVAVGMGAVICLRALGNSLTFARLASGNATGTTVLAWLQATVKVGIGLAMAPRFGILGLLIASTIASGIQIVGTTILLVRDGVIQPRVIAAWVPAVACAFAATALFRGSRATTWPELVIASFLTALAWAVGYGLAGLPLWWPGLRRQLALTRRSVVPAD